LTITVDGAKDNLYTGVAIIDGRKAMQRGDLRKGRILSRGVPMELVITVRPELVQVESNGKVIYEWHGDLRRGSRRSSQPSDPLFIGGAGGSFQFEKIMLEPLGDDRGQPLENR
jgi:hypothetical protein